MENNMKKIAALAFVGALLSSSAIADSGIRRVPCGYQQLTSIDTVASLTVPTPASCGGTVTAALIKAEAQAVRYRDDGVAPTATVGMPLAIGEPGLFYEGRLSAIQVISQTSGAKLDVLYYR
jgi:hypothetical protein